MFSCANEVPNEIDKWIIIRSIKNIAILEYGKTDVYQHDKLSKCAKFEGSNKNDTMNAKNAEITNWVIMHILNEVTSNKP